MKKIILAIASVLVVPVLALAVGQAMGVTTYAQIQAALEDSNPGNVPTTIDGDGGVIEDIINLLLYIIVIISVIMLIFGGFLYVTSAGNQEKVKNAKNTILYSVIGLIIAIFAYAIINWVAGQATGVGDGGGA